MTGVVAVSHSDALARAAVDLAQEMVGEQEVTVAVAAGVDGGFGTDAVAIGQAIERAADEDGVVVLMDLGSAVLSAETALELVPPELSGRVVLSAAPFVEGLVLAVVAAAGGAPPERVAREARGALRAKADHLGEQDGEDSPRGVVPDASVGSVDAVTATFTLTTAHGLHARPAAQLVALAQELLAGPLETITARNVSTGAGPADAESMLDVLTLGAEQGHEVEVRATGAGAGEAVERLVALNEERFGESE